RESRGGVVPPVDDRRGRGFARVLVELAGRNDHDAGADPAVLAVAQPGVWAARSSMASGRSHSSAASLIFCFKKIARIDHPIGAGQVRALIPGYTNPDSSCAGLTRASIFLLIDSYEKRWI